ncbi:superkiller complex protein 3-like [Babylonia areolata]|uniref:superkiller complex protein 3-like n=1 Tax=Babylonia areolata TaxID=304850 RepID=UPI003FD299FD
MSSKEVKNALKAAREAIRNKEFKEALKQCKVALAEDKNNYNALVFVGVAAEGLEQYEQALKAYHRAAQVSPDQLLAWQGLSSMHTKNPSQVPSEDMVGVYEKLIELYENDGDKQEEAMRKLIPLYGDADLDKVLSLYERLEERKWSYDQDVVLNLIARLQQSSASPPLQAKLLSCLRTLLTSPAGAGAGDQASIPQRDNHIHSYLLLLHKLEPERLFEESSTLMVRFPDCLFPQETRLRLLLDRQMDTTDPEEVERIKELTARLTELTQGESRSAILLFARGYLSLTEGQYTAARDALQEGVEKMKSCFCGLYYLCQALFKVHAAAACLHTCLD